MFFTKSPKIYGRKKKWLKWTFDRISWYWDIRYPKEEHDHFKLVIKYRGEEDYGSKLVTAFYTPEMEFNETCREDNPAFGIFTVEPRKGNIIRLKKSAGTGWGYHRATITLKKIKDKRNGG